MVKKKSEDKIAVPVPVPASAPDVGANNHSPIQATPDEYHGIGGSYILDPDTGKRIRVEGPAVGADSIRPEIEP